MSDNTIFAVIDPTCEAQIALNRAREISRTTGSGIHVFCCCYVSPEQMGNYSSRADAKHDTCNKTLARLKLLTAPIKEEGIAVTTEVYWNEKWYESVVHASVRSGANLIVKSTAPHSKLSRKLQKTSDYYLARHAPCPVLLAKSDKPWNNKRLLAAIAFDHPDSEHEILNNSILTQAHRLSSQFSSELHLVSALPDTVNLSEALKIFDGEQTRDRKEIIAERFGVSPHQIYLGEGETKSVILNITDSIKPDLLIMGTRARSGLQGVLLGNTAETVLDNVLTDVLIVN